MKMRSSTAAGVVWIAATASMPADDSWWAWKRYTADLKSQCPEKRLDLLPYGDLPDVIDDFAKRLTPALKYQVDRAATARCREVQMGASCGNEGFLRVMIRHGRLHEFVGFVCARPERCQTSAECKRD